MVTKAMVEQYRQGGRGVLALQVGESGLASGWPSPLRGEVTSRGPAGWPVPAG